MNRKQELLDVIGDNDTLKPLVDDMVFIEKQLESLRCLPMIRVNPSDPNLQKPTPASKQYKEFLQQYTNIVKIMLRATGQEADEDSPLRAWMKNELSDRV